MIDLPINAEVHCSDGPAGRSTGVIGNPMNRQITHLLVKSYLPPFHEYLVPVDRVEETTDNRIKLKCTRNELNKMEPFEYEDYIPTTLPDYLDWPSARPDYLDWPFVPTHPQDQINEKVLYTAVKRRNISQDELALRRGTRVEASDGYVGKVDELLIDPKDMHVTHIVLMERHIVQGKEITIPVSQIDRIAEDTIYLKLDRQSIEELPTTPI